MKTRWSAGLERAMKRSTEEHYEEELVLWRERWMPEPWRRTGEQKIKNWSTIRIVEDDVAGEKPRQEATLQAAKSVARQCRLDEIKRRQFEMNWFENQFDG